MDDSELIRHMENEHIGSLLDPRTDQPVMRWPGEVKLNAPDLWSGYHDYLHRVAGAGHTHGPSGSAPPRSRHSGTGPATEGKALQSNVKLIRKKWVQQVGCICIDPPTHMLDCPGRNGVLILEDRHGPSIRDSLWEEMDRLMEGLMTKADAEDGGDKFRAQGVAYALAVFLNPAAPNVDDIRREAVDRWNEAQSA